MADCQNNGYFSFEVNVKNNAVIADAETKIAESFIL
jgi:hypothetical protein